MLSKLHPLEWEGKRCAEEISGPWRPGATLPSSDETNPKSGLDAIALRLAVLSIDETAHGNPAVSTSKNFFPRSSAALRIGRSIFS